MWDHMEIIGENAADHLLDWMELSVHLQHKRVIELQRPSGPIGCLHGLEIKRKVNIKYIFLLATKPEYSGNVAPFFCPFHFVFRQ